MTPVSVFILTFNEAENIGRCLASLKDWTDDIIIVDSFSTDATLEICHQFGCRVVQHEFLNHALQSNWALETIEFKHAWILRLDADELLPDRLKSELTQTLQNPPSEVCGIYLNRRQYFMNRWLKHGGIYPHHILRVFRKGSGLYENKTEEHFVLREGRAIRARNDFLEDNRNNNLDFWLDKHRSLARGEVQDTLGLSYTSQTEMEPRLLGEKVQRTRWLKINLYQRAPLFVRCFAYFFYRYVLRLGFLDGLPGFIYYVNQSFWYRFFVDSRIYELRSGWKSIQLDYRDL